MTLNIIIGILSFAGAVIIALAIDLNKLFKNKGTKHFGGGLLKAALCIPAGYFLTIAHPGQLVPTGTLVLLMLMICFMFLFNGFYNLYRNPPEKWWFTGSIDENEAVTDNFWRAIGLFWTQVIQYTGTLLTIGVYILSFFLLR